MEKKNLIPHLLLRSNLDWKLFHSLRGFLVFLGPFSYNSCSVARAIFFWNILLLSGITVCPVTCFPHNALVSLPWDNSHAWNYKAVSKQIRSCVFKNVTYRLFVYKLYTCVCIYYIYKQDLALNNPQRLYENIYTLGQWVVSLGRSHSLKAIYDI